MNAPKDHCLLRKVPYKDESSGFAGLTKRSLILGICLVILINIGAPYSKHVLHSTYLASDYMPLGLMFPFLVIVAVLNVALKLIDNDLALTSAELGVIFIMGLVATTIPTIGLTGILVATISAPYYYASPENKWAETFHRYIPRWIAPKNENNAITWFYEGLPKGESVPWGEWIIPLFWWLSLIAAVLLVCLCIVVILRKQWIEKERLLFPLVEVPLKMVEEDVQRRSYLPPFMRTKVFWIGFLIPFFIVSWNIVTYFVPSFPEIPTRGVYIHLARSFPPIRTRIYFPVLGFAYLINLEVSFSIWFFYLLSVLQIGIYNRIGFSIGRAETYCSQQASMGWQGFGALTVMVIWSLWMARGHLCQVFKKALNRNEKIDDSEEMLSYRAAVLGLILGLLYIMAWLRVSGMDFFVILLFLVSALIIYIGVTRIVIEGGLMFVRSPLIAQPFAIYSLGTTSISGQSMVALAFTYAWFCDIKCVFMPAAAHASKLADRLRLGRKAILIGMSLSLLVGIAVSLIFTLCAAYEKGAYNLDRWLFQGACVIPFRSIATKIRNPFGPDLKRLSFFGIGSVVMVILTILRHRFVWWPIHPLGFTIASVQMVRNTAFTIFIAWAAKSAIIKLGGINLYQKALPFFFGLMLGYYAGLGVSFFVDVIWFPGQGHYLYGV